MSKVIANHPLKTNVLMIRFLSYLTPEDVRKNATAVNKYWRDRSNEPELWRHLFIRENGLPFNVGASVQTNQFTWKEAYRYSKAVIPFLDREAEVRMGNPERFAAANPLHSAGNPYYRSEFFCLTLPKPFAQNRGSQFSICHSTDIRVMETGAKEPTFLRGTSGQLLSHVTVFGDSVFALRCDGRVEEWNHRTKTRIRTIETAYSQDDARLKPFKDQNISGKEQQEVDLPICSQGQFVASDDFLAIAHGSSLVRTPIHFIEMIPLAGGQRYTLPQSGSPRDLQFNNRRLLVLNHASITVHFLNTQKTQKEHTLLKDVAMMLTAMTHFGNTIYAASTEKKIYISDIERGLITTVTIPSYSHNIFAWSNLLFFEHNTYENTAGNWDQKHHIDVIDQTTWNSVAGQQSDILTEKGFKPDLYEKLMLICKNHLKPLRLPPPKKQSDCVVM